MFPKFEKKKGAETIVTEVIFFKSETKFESYPEISSSLKNKFTLMLFWEKLLK